MNNEIFKELETKIETEITVSGFVNSIRDLQYVQFIILRNGIEQLQITIEKNDTNKKINDIVSNLRLESTIKVTGILKKNEKVKLKGLELIPNQIEVTSKNLDEIPVNLIDKEKTLRETRLDYRFLDLRRKEANLIFQVQTTLLHTMREYWVNHDYIEINSPKILGTASESGATVFELDYFGTKAYLAQSPQFYKQMAMAAGFNQVFEIGPVFRAENSHTSYHATEFTSIDAEISWINSYHELMDIEEKLIVACFTKIKEKHGTDLKNVLNIDLKIPTVKFPRIPFQEVKEIIETEYNYHNPKKLDIDRKEEELISDYVYKKYNSEFVFITEYPKEARPFYHMLDENNNTKSFDLIYKGIEITTGAQREHRYEILKEQALNSGLSLETIAFYLDFFKYGCPPHGGFAIGLSRVLMRLFDLDNVREVTYIYRGPNRLHP
jgi:aspartyl-tRNA synthetase